MIQRIIDELNDDCSLECIIQGEARGADTIAKNIAVFLGIHVLGFPAQWGLYGKAAGPMRNRQMLDQGKPDLVVGFHDQIHHSKGTKDMLLKAATAGIPSTLYFHEVDLP